MIYAIFAFMVISIIILLRELFINSFKISYYETKLENQNVDISSVKDAGMIDILKMWLDFVFQKLYIIKDQI